MKLYQTNFGPTIINLDSVISFTVEEYNEGKIYRPVAYVSPERFIILNIDIFDTEEKAHKWLVEFLNSKFNFDSRSWTKET